MNFPQITIQFQLLRRLKNKIKILLNKEHNSKGYQTLLHLENFRVLMSYNFQNLQTTLKKNLFYILRMVTKLPPSLLSKTHFSLEEKM